MSREDEMMFRGKSDLIERPSFAESQAKGEVDTQIATAKRFPRSIQRFKERALSLATLDTETAESCFYSLPRGGKDIEGPSVRLAEIVAASWGNLRSQANIVDEDGRFIVARGMCWDLENNVAVSTEVRRRITDRDGRRYNDDMINTTANAACSIALRNAVFKVVPMALAKPVYDAARRVAIGDATTLVQRRTKMIDHFAKMGVRDDRICAAVNRPSIEDITIDDLAKLMGMSTAIKDGDITVDEAFPAPAKPDDGKTASDKLAEKIGGSKPKDAAPREQKLTKPKRELLGTEENPLPLKQQLLNRLAAAERITDIHNIMDQASGLSESDRVDLMEQAAMRGEEIEKAKGAG